MPIEDATVKSVTCGDLFDEPTLTQVVPLLLDHLVAEATHELDVSGLGAETNVVDLAEDV